MTRLGDIQRAVVMLSSGICLSASLALAAHAGCAAAYKSSKSPLNMSNSHTQNVLGSGVKHQISSSSGQGQTCLFESDIAAGDYADNTSSSHDYFYYGYDSTRGDSLYFKVSGSNGDRSELRLPSFSARQNQGNRQFFADFNFRGRSSNWASTITLAQLHVDKNTSNSSVITSSPLARIVFIKNRSGRRNKVWLVLRADPGKTSYEYVELGGLRSGYSPNSLVLEYGVNGDELKVTYNNTRIYRSVSNWDKNNTNLYYKVGCYIQSTGSCVNQVTWLRKGGF